ncbi:MAG: hypothetical protein WDA10_06030 [Porticoccaceae bacterium]
MIGTLALNPVAALVNHALAFDPASRAALARLAGRPLAVRCTFPALELGAVFDDSGALILTPGMPEGAETCLKGSALALARLAANSNAGVTLAGSGVEMTGSQALLQDMRAVLGTLDIDWEAALAGLIGDVPAHLAAEAVRAGTGWQRQAAGRAFSGGAEFLREEAAIVVGRREFAPWASAVSQLAEDTDRLAARVARLARRLAEDGR